MYRWKFDQSTKEMQLTHVTGTDFLNLSERPVRYIADEDATVWSCRCESTMVVNQQERRLDRGGLKCSVCLKPGTGQLTIPCEGSEFDEIQTQRLGQCAVLFWGDPAYGGASPGDYIATLQPVTSGFTVNWREGPDLDGGTIIDPIGSHDDWMMAVDGATVDSCTPCGRAMRIIPPTGFFPPFFSSGLNEFITKSDGHGNCGSDPYYDRFTAYASVFSTGTVAGTMHIDWIDCP